MNEAWLSLGTRRGCTLALGHKEKVWPLTLYHLNSALQFPYIIHLSHVWALCNCVLHSHDILNKCMTLTLQFKLQTLNLNKDRLGPKKSSFSLHVPFSFLFYQPSQILFYIYLVKTEHHLLSCPVKFLFALVGTHLVNNRPSDPRAASLSTFRTKRPLNGDVPAGMDMSRLVVHFCPTHTHTPWSPLNHRDV